MVTLAAVCSFSCSAIAAERVHAGSSSSDAVLAKPWETSAPSGSCCRAHGAGQPWQRARLAVHFLGAPTSYRSGA